MGSRKFTIFTLSLGTLLLFALLIAHGVLDKDIPFVLPQHLPEVGTSDETVDSDSLQVLSVNPKTVQAAIQTLSRPASYQRTQEITLFWSSGSSTSTSNVAVKGDLTRVDTVLSDDSICHTLTDGEHTAVWYDDDTTWTLLQSTYTPADALMRMPTYEDVLHLPIFRIAQAEYSQKDSLFCIYVETTPDSNGYVDRYWISVQSGLLYAAERTSHGTLIYRFQSSEPKSETPDEKLFLLPNGSQL
ncbi:MAG: hypothetical protein IJ955_10215 [Oscillospiraceae bacterium]|nr:hypothetical protein [Oscillospiraceae bacterium]